MIGKDIHPEKGENIKTGIEEEVTAEIENRVEVKDIGEAEAEIKNTAEAKVGK